MSDIGNPMQLFNDWLHQQKASLEKMPWFALASDSAGEDRAAQGPMAPLVQAWQAQSKGAMEAFDNMAKSMQWPAASGTQHAATEGHLPLLPNLIDPAVQARLQEFLRKFRVTAEGKSQHASPLIEDLMGQPSEAPNLATLWDLDQKLIGLYGAWFRLQGASLAYRTVVGRAWTVAQAKMTRNADLATTTKKPNGGIDWRKVVDDWLAALNESMLELMRGDDYLKAQKQLLVAGLDVREHLGRLGEDVAEWFQLPGREEVDDLARSVSDLKRQLRRMAAAANASLESTTAAPAGKAAIKIARPRSKRKDLA